MNSQEENPQSASEAEQGAQESKVRAKNTSDNGCMQGLAAIFAAILDLPVWVASGSNKAPRDSEGKPFNDWSNPNTVLSTYAEARATAAKHDLPHIGLIFPAGGIVVDGWRLLGIDVDEVEGYRKRRPDKPGKPGCNAITFNPATDADAIMARVPLVGQLPRTVWEVSTSNTSIHGFVWVPDDQDYWGVRHAKLSGCAHADSFVAGRKAAHLIVTGVSLNGCTTIARVTDLTTLQPLLQPAGNPNGPPELIITDEGHPFDLTALALTEDQRHLVKGTGELDRSKTMHGLLIRLIDEGRQFGDILASLCANDYTRAYLLDHRNQDPTNALEFGRYEIRKAYAESMRRKMDVIRQYYPAWRDGELLADPAEAPADFEVNQWRTLTREDGRTTLDDLHKVDPPWPHVAGPSRPMKCLSIVAGAGGAGKSTEILNQELCIACGLPYRGMPTIQGISIFASCEDSRIIIKARIQAWLKAVPADIRPRVEADLQKNFYFFGNDEVGGMQVTIRELSACKPSREAVEKLCELGHGAVSMTVETVAMINGGDELNTDMMQLALALKEVALRTGANVQAIHHLSKEALKHYPPSLYSLRGAAALADALRGCVIMVELPPNEYKRLHITRIDAAPVYALWNVKSNYQETHLPIYLRRLPGPIYVEVDGSEAKGMQAAEDRLFGYMSKKPGEWFSLRQLQDDCTQFRVDRREVGEVLLRLEKDRKVEQADSKELKKPGRAHVVWRVLIESQT